MSNSILPDQSKKRIVFTVGVFDLFHIGHVNLFKKARSCGDCLIVAVQDDVEKYKPDAKIYYSLEERLEVVRSCRFVDEVVVYDDVDQIIKTLDFDIFAIGPDQKHAGFQRAMKYCEENNKKVIEIPRTRGVSSTIIREIYK